MTKAQIAIIEADGGVRGNKFDGTDIGRVARGRELRHYLSCHFSPWASSSGVVKDK